MDFSDCSYIDFFPENVHSFVSLALTAIISVKDDILQQNY